MVGVVTQVCCAFVQVCECVCAHICVVRPQVNKFSVIGLASCSATSLTISVHLGQCFEDLSSHQDDLHCPTAISCAADPQSSASLCAVCQVDVSNCAVKVICESGLPKGI